MASVSRDANGTKRLFTDREGERKAVRLAGFRQGRRGVPPETPRPDRGPVHRNGDRRGSARWLADLPDRMCTPGRLVAEPARRRRRRWVGCWTTTATLNVKPGTRIAPTRRRGPRWSSGSGPSVRWRARSLDADRWRAAMVRPAAPATISKRIKTARAIFARGGAGGCSENPLTGVKAGKQTNPARKVFVPGTRSPR